MDGVVQTELDEPLATIATHEDMLALREDMTICMERVRRDIHALIDAFELMRYIDSKVD